MQYWNDWDDKPIKRTLGIRDKQILYQRDKGRCEACGKKIEFAEMEVGHKKAHSRGGRATFTNSVCLCHKCNKLQGTDNWATFLKKLKKKEEDPKMKKMLKTLSLKQLKFLAKKHYVKVKGGVVEDWGETYRKPPSKTQYVNALANVISEKDIESDLKEIPKTKKKRKKRETSDWFW